jgi:hypothetical protein
MRFTKPAVLALAVILACWIFVLVINVWKDDAKNVGVLRKKIVTITCLDGHEYLYITTGSTSMLAPRWTNEGEPKKCAHSEEH